MRAQQKVKSVLLMIALGLVSVRAAQQPQPPCGGQSSTPQVACQADVEAPRRRTLPAPPPLLATPATPRYRAPQPAIARHRSVIQPAARIERKGLSNTK